MRGKCRKTKIRRRDAGLIRQGRWGRRYYEMGCVMKRKKKNEVTLYQDHLKREKTLRRFAVSYGLGGTKAFFRTYNKSPSRSGNK